MNKGNLYGYQRHWTKIQKDKAIEFLGGKCVKCGFSDKRALQIDHINGGGRRENTTSSNGTFYRKVLKDKNNTYQLLCANCNWIKRHENLETTNAVLYSLLEKTAEDLDNG